MYLAYYLAAEQYSKKANPSLDKSKFDADNARYGIATSELGFTNQKIMDIAARCGVRPNKYNVLPEDGWKHCIDYVTQYINSPNDLTNFERDWKNCVNHQLAKKSNLMVEKYWEHYERQYNGYLKNKEFWTSGPAITLEFRHWHGLPKDQYLERLDNLQTKTFWGELALQKPILRKNPRIKNSFIEVWVMQGCECDRQDSWLTKNTMRTTYKICC